MVYYPTLFFDGFDEFAFDKDYSGFIHKIYEYNNDDVVCFGKISIDISDETQFSPSLLVEDIYFKLPALASSKEFILIDKSRLLFKYYNFYLLLNWTVSSSECSIGVMIGKNYIIDDKDLYIIYDDDDEANTVIGDDFYEYQYDSGDEGEDYDDLVIIN